ncbi:MAG: hypothetical protein EBU90_08445 [Proteobacteria bacterium]|nr:hypothetical protein [Pseudomonadota bacterium]
MTDEQIIQIAREHLYVLTSVNEWCGEDKDILKFARELYTEQEELLKKYQQEIEKCWKLAQRLDALNPELTGDFTETPSERIEQQLCALGILK